MSTTLRTLDQNGHALDQNRPIPSPIDTYRPLDQFDAGAVPTVPRLDAIATVSAGFRDRKPDGTRGLPQRTKTGEIYLHDVQGLAPGLAAALSRAEGRHLMIAFPSDDPDHFIQARYTRYSSTALEAYGDQFSITVLVPGPRRVVYAGAAGYDAERARMKVSASIYFMLADWEDGGPVVVFPDGVGYYRIRTGKNSLRNLDAALKAVSRFTGGSIAGLPFRAAIDFRDFSDGAGKRNTASVWTFVPGAGAGTEIRLTSRTWRSFAMGGLTEGQALMLPAPTAETLEHELLEPSETDVEILSRGGLCDFRYWNKRWHVAVKGSPLEDKVSRAHWLDEYTRGDCLSLAEFLEGATEDEAAALVVAVQDTLQRFPEWPDGVDSATPLFDELGNKVAADAPAEPAVEYPSDDAMVYWMALRSMAEQLGIDPDTYATWGTSRPTMAQLRAAYESLRAAVKRVGRERGAQPAAIDSESMAAPAMSVERRRGLLNEHKILGARAKELGASVDPLSEDISDVALVAAVAELRQRNDAATLELEAQLSDAASSGVLRRGAGELS